MAKENGNISSGADQGTQTDLEECPKCGGQSGYRFAEYVKETWKGKWDSEILKKQDAEPIPTMESKNVICKDCGGYIPKKDVGVN